MKKNSLNVFDKIWRVALCVAVPLGGGFAISLFTRDAMEKFGALTQPPLSPPAWLFPVAWTVLYILMGVASYIIYRASSSGDAHTEKSSRTALIIYGIQLALNFAWTPIFFSMNAYWPAFVVLITMWALEIVLVAKSLKISKVAFWCLLPYLIWTTFAAYLNVSIAILN